MSKSISNRIAIAVLLLFPCALMAQGTAPSWLDGDVRNMQYPPETYYSGFAEVVPAQGASQERALTSAKQQAVGELSERVRVVVNTDKTSIDISLGGSDIEEQIRSKFTAMVKTASQTEVVGSKVETWYDSRTRTAYAFARVSKAELAAYYRKQIEWHLNKVDGALRTATELAGKGYKMKARKECMAVVDAFAAIAYAQDLLTAIDEHADDGSLQQNRSERLRNVLVQTIVDMENSTYIYVECHETVNGQTVVHIGDRLPGLLGDNGCECNITDSEETADYVIRVDARLARCNDAPDDIVFCYATATVSVYNVRTQKTLVPKIPETKGGWTNKNRAKAAEEAFNELADRIAEKVVPMIKN